MKLFSIIILGLYFGFKILSGFISIANWNKEEYINVREMLGMGMKEFIMGILEHSILLLTALILYFHD
jgi:hypothetical protein